MKPLGPTDPYRVGRYRLVAELGRGGMGRVLLAAAPDGRLVALKQVRAQFTEDDGFRARFRREVAASRRVSGGHTAAVVDADPDGPAPWLASLFVPGPSLREAVDATGALPADPAARLAAGLAAALAEIHAAGLVHRDLKPSNVLLTDGGPCVIDFGIARATDAQGGTEVTHTGWLVGSPGFMSPEQAEGRPVTPASDMFSLGTVLVMACTGGNPFDGASTPQTLYNVVFAEPDLGAVPDRLRDAVARCLAKDPDQRPTPAELLAHLGDLAPGDLAPGDLPWPPAVHDMIAAQRAELTRLMATAGERARLLGTVATLLTESARKRTVADQPPAPPEPPTTPPPPPAGSPMAPPAEPPPLPAGSPATSPTVPPTTPAGPPATSPAGSPMALPAEPPPLPAGSPATSPGGLPVTSPAGPAAVSPAMPPTVPSAEPVGPPLLPPPLPVPAAESPTMPQQPPQQPVEFTPASYPVTPPPGSGPPAPPPMSTPPMGPPPYGPPPYGMPTGPLVPQPRKSNTNLIIGLVAGALTVVVVACLVGGIALYDSIGSGHSSATGGQHSATPSPTDDPYTYSPSPSPSPTARDPYSLDDESTDDTTMDLAQFFPSYIEDYELAADSMYSVCSDAGGDATESLISKHSSCGAMPTADYLDTTNRLMASVMVIPLSTSSDADTVHSTLQSDANNMTDAWTGLRYYCPQSGTGSHVCDAGKYPRWRAYYPAYHRYIIVVTLLRLDGGATPDSTAVETLGNAVLTGVENQMLVIM
jgi:eukaryotic-like serine/threonine-protein kinase